MKTLRFSEEQIIGVLREQEAGAKTADVCRKHGMSAAACAAEAGEAAERDAVLVARWRQGRSC